MKPLQALQIGCLMLGLSACTSPEPANAPSAMQTPAERGWVSKLLLDPLHTASRGLSRGSEAIAKPIGSGLRKIGGIAGSAGSWLPQAATMETLKKVPRLLPGVQAEDRANAQDPLVPFDPLKPLATGHSLRLQMVEGSRSPDEILSTVAVIEPNGQIDLGRAGRPRVGGMRLPQAVEAINAHCRLSLSVGRSLSTHVISIENQPLVAVVGEVTQSRHLALSDGLSLGQAVSLCGGRQAKSGHRAIYLTRSGERRFFPHLEACSSLPLEAGDIVELSSDL
jgi:protein involved in polysaccharide export with SLBB domain